MTTTTRTPLAVCHNCNRALDAVTHATNGVPHAGDFTVCITCAALHRFNADMSIRPVTREEWAELDPETRSWLWRMRKMVLEMHGAMN